MGRDDVYRRSDGMSLPQPSVRLARIPARRTIANTNPLSNAAFSDPSAKRSWRTIRNDRWRDAKMADRLLIVAFPKADSIRCKRTQHEA
jgi:hypothetical protein